MTEIETRTSGPDLRRVGGGDPMAGPGQAPDSVTTGLRRSGEAAGGDTSARAIEIQLGATVEHVQLDLHRSVPETRIRAFVARAYRDLKGSVNSEALPEMAGRLAAERLRGGGFAVTHSPVTTRERNREGTRS